MHKNCQKCNRKFVKRETCSKKEWVTSKYCSHSCSNSATSNGKKWFLGMIPWNKGKEMLDIRGENNPNWKGGLGGERHQAMGRIEYKIWRDLVFKRDNFTCQICEQYGGYMHADHIKSWSEYPELRYEIRNGRTLCRTCHYYVTFKHKISPLSQWGLVGAAADEA